MDSKFSLKPEELKRWRFNELMDYNNKPVRTPADCMAFYQNLLAEAWAAFEERRTAAAALPYPTGWFQHQEKEVKAIRATKEAADRLAREQEFHFYKLRERYSYELAHALWWKRVDAVRARGDAIREAYQKAWEEHRAEQDAFEKEQAAKAVAEIAAANPHLPEATLDKLCRKLKYRIYLASHGRSRSDVPRRAMRGMPLVLCGLLPCKARLEYGPEDNAIYFHCF
jgi:hypothetical protein